MTLAFNLQLAQQRGMTFACCFVAGNLGLAWAFHNDPGLSH